jgi:hypothetical protein
MVTSKPNLHPQGRLGSSGRGMIVAMYLPIFDMINAVQ